MTLPRGKKQRHPPGTPPKGNKPPVPRNLRRRQRQRSEAARKLAEKRARQRKIRRKL